MECTHDSFCINFLEILISSFDFIIICHNVNDKILRKFKSYKRENIKKKITEIQKSTKCLKLVKQTP
jgi:hypothetical protein